ncbi:MAG: efflux RND transporter periplasmic adaptor subunit [Nannocystales bacterium]
MTNNVDPETSDDDGPAPAERADSLDAGPEIPPTPGAQAPAESGGLMRALVFTAVGFGLGAGALALFSPGEESKDETHAHGEASDVATTWTCSMHPQIQLAEPGQCPICGMTLIPVSNDAGDDLALAADRIVLSERARVLSKLTTAKVRRQAHATADLRLLGRIEPNEASLKTVTSWIGGRIDKLRVRETGKRVRKGQVIATLYSPEVFAAHQDLLVAKRQVDRMRDSPETSRWAADAALDAARERLALLGVPDAEVTRMEGQKKPTRAVAIRSPFSGTVIERIATEGVYITTGASLYRIANLNTLWVQLDAYESDLARLSLQQTVQVSVEAVPDEVFEGTVTFIDPILDAKRRTARVRVQLDNRDGRLRPGMFAEATVATKHPEGSPTPLVVPSTAPLFTGRRAVVYVEVETEARLVYEARIVRLGPRLGKFYPVVAGLSEGERVVTRGAFALDADLQIRGGASMMTSADDSEEGIWDRVVELSDEQRQELAPVVTAYLAVQVALADDDLERAKTSAEVLSDAVVAVKMTRPTEAREAWSESSVALRGHGQHVSKAQTLEDARAGFEPLSEAVIGLMGRFGNPLEGAVHLAHCPMASQNEGALWLQQGTVLDNPYFGASMLDCGEIRKEVGPGAYLRPPSARAARAGRPAAGGHQH